MPCESDFNQAFVFFTLQGNKQKWVPLEINPPKTSRRGRRSRSAGRLSPHPNKDARNRNERSERFGKGDRTPDSAELAKGKVESLVLGYVLTTLYHQTAGSLDVISAVVSQINIILF